MWIIILCLTIELIFIAIFLKEINTSLMLKTPLVSICIPLYNASEYIHETLTRILNQTYKNIEVVVVDDYSTDESYTIAKTFESNKIRVLKNKKKGGNAARNFAFQNSKGDYVKFMDADDYCSENMIKAQLERLLKEGTNQTLVFSKLRVSYLDVFYDYPRDIDKDYEPGIELLVDIWRLKGYNCPHCYLLSRQLVEQTGGWNETILKNQDAEFFARVIALADKALSVPNEFAVWRQTGKGVSTNTSTEAINSVIDTLDIISKLILRYNDTAEMREICGTYIGAYVLGNYSDIKHLLPKVEQLLHSINAKMKFPNRKLIRLFTFCFGWKSALPLIYNLQVFKKSIIVFGLKIATKFKNKVKI
tara:strand:+ start:1858 stop:2943 length:1086 start_codon:yes stop_codon:yes gene_type:complete